MQIKYNDLAKQWKIIEPFCTGKITNFLQSGNYMDNAIKYNFEAKFLNILYPKYEELTAVGVSNGTSALRIALECLELKGSTCVVLPTNTFISNALVTTQLGYSIKLLDFDTYLQQNILDLDDYLKYTRDSFDNIVIMAVHLTGHTANMQYIKSLADIYGCYIIEDCSQALGSKGIDRNPVGLIGDISTFSFFPTKNLGAVGEAGLIMSKNPNYITLARAKSKNGSYSINNAQTSSVLGNNDRIDSLQCIILTEKLKHVKEWNDQKQLLATVYNNKILNSDLQSFMEIPDIANWCIKHTYHTYTIRLKTKTTNYVLNNLLNEYGIETRINYKPFIHNVPYYNNKKRKFPYADNMQDRVLNLPMHAFITEEEIDYVCTVLQKCLTT